MYRKLLTRVMQPISLERRRTDRFSPSSHGGGEKREYFNFVTADDMNFMTADDEYFNVK